MKHPKLVKRAAKEGQSSNVALILLQTFVVYRKEFNRLRVFAILNWMERGDYRFARVSVYVAAVCAWTGCFTRGVGGKPT